MPGLASASGESLYLLILQSFATILQRDSQGFRGYACCELSTSLGNVWFARNIDFFWEGEAPAEPITNL
jgi:hypothetical protein